MSNQSAGRKFDRCRKSNSHARYVAEDRAAKRHRKNIAKAEAMEPKVLKVPHGSARAARRANIKPIQETVS